jgi:hypothetical protein
MSSKRRFRGGGRRFIQLYHNVKNSRAYHDLSVYGRSALVELLARYTGINNGMIGLGCRELADELGCARDTAAKALIELDNAGLARPLTHGVWRGKKATPPSPQTKIIDDPRIRSLARWGEAATRKSWSKPTILSDAPRDLNEFPADDMAA